MAYVGVRILHIMKNVSSSIATVFTAAALLSITPFVALANTHKIDNVSTALTGTDTTYNIGNKAIVNWDGLNVSDVQVRLMEAGKVVAVLATSTPVGSAPFSWRVPSVKPASDYIVRVVDLTTKDRSIYADSPAIKIESHGVTLTDISPAAYTIGGKVTVNWLFDGSTSIAHVYLIKGTGSPVRLTPTEGVPASQGRFTWTIPTKQEPGTDYRIRVTSGDAKATADSNVFSIAAAGITVVAPPADGSYAPGTGLPVQFTVANPRANMQVTITLVRNGTDVTTPAPITMPVVAGTNTATFATPSTIPVCSTSCYSIRVQDVANTNVKGMSPAFKIAYGSDTTAHTISNVAVALTGTDKTFNIGNKATIVWKGQNMSTVRLVLMKGGTQVGSAIAPSVAVNAAPFAWTVPNVTPGKDYTVRVVDTGNAGVYADSDAFEITSHGVTVGAVTPATVALGGKVNFTWQFDGTTGTAVVYLLKGGAVQGAALASIPAATNAFSWTVPAGTTPGIDYAFRVTSGDGKATGDTTNTFTVSGPMIAVTAPTSAAPGASVPVNFTVTNARTNMQVKVSFVKDGAVQTLPAPFTMPVVEGANAHTFALTTAQPVCSGTTSCYTIHIEDVSNASVKADSVAFAIAYDVSTTAHSITDVATSIAGDSTYNVGNTANVVWKGVNVSKVNISLIGSGKTTTLASGLAVGAAPYAWKVPNVTPGSGYVVRVTDANNAGVYMESPAFQVREPFITVTAPATGSSVATSTTAKPVNVTATWSVDGELKAGTTLTIVPLKGGVATTPTKPSIALTATTANWPVPTTARGTDYQLRVQGVAQDGTTVSGTSGMFSILPPGATASAADLQSQLASALAALQQLLGSLQQ